MFGKILKVLGAIFLAIFLIGGVAFYFVAQKGDALDKSSVAYANSAIPAIFNNWNYEELKKRADPLLYSSASEQQIKDFFTAFSQLGKLESFGGCQGEANINFGNGTAGKNISANYLCPIKFEKDTADITLVLLQDEQKNWRIAGLLLNTKTFFPKR